MLAELEARRAVIASPQVGETTTDDDARTAHPAISAESSPQTTAPIDHDISAQPSVAEPRGRTFTVPSGAELSPEERMQQLATVAGHVAACTRCPELARGRTQTVFGVGNPQARVMFVGEAPGADEDRQGEPFVGKAGQLLNKIIGACGWQREELYICNILRCRPPGNRTPEKAEADNCREFLDAQIQLVQPEYIVCWGSCAANNLLGEVTPIGRMRGRWYHYASAKVLCTYHPSYLLRNPDAKKPVWEDMKLLLADMGIELPSGR
ncbi:MAG: uracil-DNA glycosylase [Planctomycetaceae bacterium]|nr:uracil-DNA glycosylase [Planctomycetaceae bacterium]